MHQYDALLSCIGHVLGEGFEGNRGIGIGLEGGVTIGEVDHDF
jgi:hypothetical protein